MKVHFIAIGGAAMHNLAIALHLKGYQITGSDDQIFDPSKSRLEKHGLLPTEMGWHVERIHSDLDAIILGMHAREDNPELAKAQELRLKIFSYPEYIFEQTKDKTRVVIGGSHGKTSTTAMILHILNYHNIENDYMVGAQLDGFDCMVRLSETAKIAVLEGDEYLSSPIDRRPKFHLYRPNIALVTGIAWDHINVFPTLDIYVDQFREFIKLIESDGQLIYFDGDNTLEVLAEDNDSITAIPYNTHPHYIKDGTTVLTSDDREYPIRIFGDHNLQNLNGALQVCICLGVTESQFYEAIQTFGGAARRLELIDERASSVMYKDFAHSPSKLKATTEALKNQYPDRELIACMELHTFSSLNKAFLSEYEGAMTSADRALVYFNPETIKHKKLEPISKEEVLQAFGGNNVEVFTESEAIIHELKQITWEQRNLLLMTSGNFGGVDLDELVKGL